MAQTGFTPIQLYRTTTASATPSAGNLADGELAINTNDGRLFYKDSGGAVQTIAWKITPISAGGTGATSAAAALAALGAVAKAGDTMTGPLIVNVSSASDALRITQTGSGNALVVEDSANPDATPFVITASGAVGVGITPVTTLTVGGGLAVIRTDTVNPLQAVRLDMYRQRSGPAIVQDGDDIALLAASGWDGASYIQATSIISEVDGTPGTNDMPGRLVFSTTADGASSPTERMRITSAGNVGIGVTSPGFRLDVRDASNTTVHVMGNTSGVRVGASVDTPVASAGFVGTYSNHPLTLGINNAERMRIDASGNVGIGTSSPTARLDLGSITHATPATGVTASLWNQTGNVFGLGVSASQLNYIAGTTTANAHVWYSNSSERMRISSAGNVGIGTASPGAALDISSTNFIRYTRFGANSVFVYRRANGTEASPTAVASGESCFTRYDFYDGSSYVPGAQISAIVDGTPGTNDMPTRLGFFVTADGSSTVTEQMRLDNAGNLRFNSGYGSVATAYGCRAWVNFNGTGTVAIRASGNVSSITDNGTGDYTVNFTNAMPDANYAISVNGRINSGAIGVLLANANVFASNATTFCRMTIGVDNSSQLDGDFVNVAIFR